MTKERSNGKGTSNSSSRESKKQRTDEYWEKFLTKTQDRARATAQSSDNTDRTLTPKTVAVPFSVKCKQQNSNVNAMNNFAKPFIKTSFKPACAGSAIKLVDSTKKKCSVNILGSKKEAQKLCVGNVSVMSAKDSMPQTKLNQNGQKGKPNKGYQALMATHFSPYNLNLSKKK